MFSANDAPTLEQIAPVNDPVDEKTYCSVHPTVETALRCNKCGRYMCIKCAVKVPVGYRCRQCVYQQQDAFFSATRRDDLVALGVGFLLGLPAAYLLPRVGIFLIIILGLPIGGLIGEAVARATGRRRGRYIWMFATVGLVIATAIMTYPTVIQTINYWQAMNDPNNPMNDPEFSEYVDQVSNGLVIRLLVDVLIQPGLFLLLGAGAMIARLRGR